MIEFTKDALGVKLTEEQEAFIEEIADKIHRGEPLLIMARRPGKTTMAIKVLQKLAGKYIDDGDPVRASIALREAKKLVEKTKTGTL
jgi:AAA+ ATPase superfamily predicted ATPase